MQRKKTRHPRSRLKLVIFTSIPTILLLLLIELVLHSIGIPYAPDALLRPHFVGMNSGMEETDAFLDELEGGAFYQSFPHEKGRGVFRVAILGGSSVEKLGNAGLLQEKLLSANVAEKVEVLNFGLCGCGTDRALVSAAQALELDVDAILLYAGHNEFISESNYKTYKQPVWFLRSSRLLQLIAGNPWKPEPGRLYSHEQKEAVYSQFRKNLKLLNTMTEKAGVPLIWGTVASNLNAEPLLYDSEWYDPSELPQEPILEFRKGQRLLDLHRYQDAKHTLQKAIANSSRPFRATWRINQILRETAEELSVPVADVEQRVEENAPHGIPGWELFFDHCHLTLWGDTILLETFAEVLIKHHRAGIVAR